MLSKNDFFCYDHFTEEKEKLFLMLLHNRVI